MVMIMTQKLRIHVFIESKFMASKKTYRIIDWLQEQKWQKDPPWFSGNNGLKPLRTL